jgi:hypothetical protein
MPADANDRPALREAEAEVIDLEVVDDGHGGRHDVPPGGSPENLAAMAPGLLVQAFRGLLKEKLKRWAIRSLVWATVLLFLAQEHTWARWVFGIWAFIAGVHLAFLVYGWYASGKQGARLAQLFSGMGGGPFPGGQSRED